MVATVRVAHDIQCVLSLDGQVCGLLNLQDRPDKAPLGESMNLCTVDEDAILALTWKRSEKTLSSIN